MEFAADIVLLVLRSESGLSGVAETPVRLRWNSASIRSFLATLEDVVLPVISGIDLIDPEAVAGRLAMIREHPLAKSLVDVACWDLRAQHAGMPLWRFLGASSGLVAVSFTVTRNEPKIMASEAASIVDRFGITALKVKTGQGFEVDRAVLSEIRSAVGSSVRLFADSNGAHPVDQVYAMSDMLADLEVSYFEDPCPLLPTRQFRDIKASCALPILVDNGCRSARDARLFVEAGAEALSVKIMKTGITESAIIGTEANRAGIEVSVGISASSDLGAIPALALANSLPGEARSIPCEETFFITAGGYLHEPLRVTAGCVELPNHAGLEGLIDWRKVGTLRLDGNWSRRS
jgi:L-alanine-DL-glutamate epimerase-like enolase superfamily enzyme